MASITVIVMYCTICFAFIGLAERHRGTSNLHLSELVAVTLLIASVIIAGIKVSEWMFV